MNNEQFIREEMLLGKENLEKLHNSHVAVFGLGGVGSWCTEALARAGVGALTLVDSDEFSVTNINRQSEALWSMVGRPKAEVMAERVRAISPECRVNPVYGLYDAEHRSEFFPEEGERYTFVADCIDLVSCKLDLIETCRSYGIPMISALGTGNKKDAQQLRIADISETYGDALARVMRKEMRKRGMEHHPVIFSPEEPLPCEQKEAPPPGRRSVPGSLVWVTASAGFLMAQYIILNITGGNP